MREWLLPLVYTKKNNIFKHAPKTTTAQLMSTLECITPLAYVRRRLTEGGGGVREAASLPSPAPNPTPTPVVPCTPSREHPLCRSNIGLFEFVSPLPPPLSAVKIEQLRVLSEVNSGGQSSHLAWLRCSEGANLSQYSVKRRHFRRSSNVRSGIGWW